MSNIVNGRKAVLAVVVAALGYFVDLYDLLLFSVVRKASLLDLGVAEAQSLHVGLNLLNWQLAGMLLGGLLWGVVGDKRGRRAILFGSILLYSLVNLANAGVQSVDQYRVLRFLAGIGLAGELGAGIALTSELLSARTRGYGTMAIASFGTLGVFLASWLSLSYHWRTCYIIGGVMGIALLVLRIAVLESPMFYNALSESVARGSLVKLFTDRTLLSKYLKCILVGTPTYFVIGILLTGAPEIGRAVGVGGTATAAVALMVFYLTNALADIVGSSLSQFWRSRRKAMLVFHGITLIGIVVLLYTPSHSLNVFYAKYAVLGTGLGLWAVMLSNAAEQFGTNFRATVATSAPNFIRALLIPISIIYQQLQPQLGIIHASAVVGIACVLVAMAFVILSDETFGRELNYVERV